MRGYVSPNNCALNIDDKVKIFTKKKDLLNDDHSTNMTFHYYKEKYITRDASKVVIKIARYDIIRITTEKQMKVPGSHVQTGTWAILHLTQIGFHQ